MHIIATETHKNVTKILKNFSECRRSVAAVSSNPFQCYWTSSVIKSMFYDQNDLRMTYFAVSIHTKLPRFRRLSESVFDRKKKFFWKNRF